MHLGNTFTKDHPTDLMTIKTRFLKGKDKETVVLAMHKMSHMRYWQDPVDDILLVLLSQVCVLILLICTFELPIL